MSLGARKAFQEIPQSMAREQWLAMPFLGIDGMPKTGQAYVRQGWLTATIIVPTNTGTAIEMLTAAIRTGANPPEKTLIGAQSCPSIEELSRKRSQKGHASGKS